MSKLKQVYFNFLVNFQVCVCVLLFRALQETNVGLSGEVAILKKKMGEFEAKVTLLSI